MTNLVPFAIAWCLLGVAVIGLAFKRKQVASHEDDSLHLNASSGVVTEQVSMAQKLEAIDKWGRMLTILLVVTGLALGIAYGFSIWDATSKAGF